MDIKWLLHGKARIFTEVIISWIYVFNVGVCNYEGVVMIVMMAVRLVMMILSVEHLLCTDITLNHLDMLIYFILIFTGLQKAEGNWYELIWINNSRMRFHTVENLKGFKRNVEGVAWIRKLLTKILHLWGKQKPEAESR